MKEQKQYYVKNNRLYHRDCKHRIDIYNIVHDWVICEYCSSQRNDKTLVGVSGIERADIKPLFEYSNRLVDRREHIVWCLAELPLTYKKVGKREKDWFPILEEMTKELVEINKYLNSGHISDEADEE